MKKTGTIILIVIVIILLGLAAALKRSANPVVPVATGLQVCPQEKIDNQMPGPGGAKPSYYILNGERKEISDFDAAWVAANCTVPTQTVY